VVPRDPRVVDDDVDLELSSAICEMCLRSRDEFLGPVKGAQVHFYYKEFLGRVNRLEVLGDSVAFIGGGGGAVVEDYVAAFRGED
jgi:hypothetical protein